MCSFKFTVMRNSNEKGNDFNAFNMSPNQCFYHKYHTPTPPSFLSFLMQRMFTLLDIYRMRTDVLGFFSLSLQREFHCFTEKAIWNVTGSEVRVKWKTAVIMSAGQHSRERNFFQSLGHGSRGVGGYIFCLEINWFNFLLWVLSAVTGRVTKRGEFLTFYSQSQKVRTRHHSKEKQMMQWLYQD